FIVSMLSSKETLISTREPTVTSWETNPTYEKTKMEFTSATSSVYWPFKLVTVPLLVPFSIIVTPVSPVLSLAEVTVPVIWIATSSVASARPTTGSASAAAMVVGVAPVIDEPVTNKAVVNSGITHLNLILVSHFF